ncbi:tRNA lysidine(34) synthetase TilS [Pseudooctadecabacter jejudonensis]|uniref:tRNA(Ile)-lysidine synthase n=1 Tax=Pseudooctadecabacter jejudonensis TaxID=1391910 RepID=A0A1Y5T1C2_9RHOB|nr:tRNA lysidine(34) synthetase TilS [Pseudooctadecabacter jejudonensis]SLN49841.1 tRNA(Ile)-lysidine synthase [Pseudooctadecabacter jejudonensis]
MRLTPDQLAAFGPDGGLVHFIDTAFSVPLPDKVGVAVSGGGDSMAVLHVAKAWSDLAGIPVEAVTVHHGLRIDAMQEAEAVAAFCAQAGIYHETLKWAGTEASGNIPAAAREARYRMMAEWAQARGIGGMLVGHTADDVAETFLMRLGRKAGVDGLSLMDVRFDRHGMRWARPFWQQNRADLRDYLRRHDVTWADDPTNEDETYDRPKARRALGVLAPLGITVDGLKDVALNILSARTALEYYAMQEAERAVTFSGGDVIIARTTFPDEIKRRLWLAALRHINGAGYAPRQSALGEMEQGLGSTGKHTLAGCLVTQSDTETRFSREFAACAGDMTWPHGAPSVLWDGRWEVTVEDSSRIVGNLTVRALGNAVSQVADWRETGLSRASLMASPAVFEGDRLQSAPVAGHNNGFRARIVAAFGSFLLSR